MQYRMVDHEGLSSTFFVIISFICHFTVSNVTASRWTSFDRFYVKQERFSSPYRTLTQTSRLHCSVVCAEEEGQCRGFNHHDVVGTCELIDSAGLEQERHATTDKVWTIYTKDTCNDGWVNFIGHCYLFENTNTVNWGDAKNHCESESATLAVIETAEENQFLKDLLTRLTKDMDMTNMGVWIAGLEVDGEGNWHWYPDNSEIQYSDFYPGQSASSIHENCLHMWWGFGFKWADYGCHELQYYVCEK